MTLQIMNCFDDKMDVEIGGLDDIFEINVLVLSGDEILQVRKKDGRYLEVDSDTHWRNTNFFDGQYTIYHSVFEINKIEEWQKRTTASEWC